MIAVTGGSGHLGATLVRRLLERGERVRVLVHEDGRAFDRLAVERVPGDVRDPEAVGRLVDGAAQVYHLAAAISLRAGDAALTDAVNRGGTHNVIEACRSRGAGRLVHVSSIHALAPEPIDQIVDESRPLVDGEQVHHYDRSKARAEAEVRAAVADGLDAVILNPTALLGPFDFRPSEMGAFFAGLCRRSLPGLVEADFDWVDVRDVADLAIACARSAKRGDRFVVAGHRESLLGLAELVHQITGARPPRLVSPMWLAKLTLPFASGWSKVSGTPPLYSRESLHVLECYRRVDGGKAGREHGFVARPLRDTVRDAVEWLRAAGLVNA